MHAIFCLLLLPLCNAADLITSSNHLVSVTALHEAIKKVKPEAPFPFFLTMDLSVDLFRTTLFPQPLALCSSGIMLEVDDNEVKVKGIALGGKPILPGDLFRSICERLRELGGSADPEECSLPWSRKAVEAIIERRRRRVSYVEREYIEMLWSLMLRVYRGPTQDDLKALNLVYAKGYNDLLDAMDSPRMLVSSKTIARGTFGNVRKCRDEDRHYAAKFIDLTSEELSLAMIVNEVESLRKLNGVPNVVQLFRAQLNSLSEVVIVMEYLKGVEGFDFFYKYQTKPFDLDPGILAAIFKELILGLQGIHRQNIIHSDLKWENMHLGCDGRVTIIDFGLSVPVGEMIQSSTPCFSPSEFFLSQVEAKVEFDIFQLGMMLYYFWLDDCWDDAFLKESSQDTLGALMRIRVEEKLLEYLAAQPEITPEMEAMREFIYACLFRRKSLHELLQSKFIRSAVSPEVLQAWLRENIPLIRKVDSS